MDKKCSLCEKKLDTFMPFRCRRCGHLFCDQHRLPENHSCIGLHHKKGSISNWAGEEKKYHKESQIIKPYHYPKKTSEELHPKITEKNEKDLERRYLSYGSLKSPLYKHSNKLISWFFWKKHPHSKLRKENFLIHLAIIIGLSLVFWGVYVNSNALNEVVLWIFRLGALIQICLIIFIVRSIYKILVNLRYGIKGLANGFKFIAVIISLLFCVQIFLQPGLITDPITQFNYDALNPISGNIANTGLPSIIPAPEINIQELEMQIHNLINNERQQYGLPSLEYDSKLADIARAHSQDMANRNYFDHVNPEGDGPTERAIKAGYSVHKEYGGGVYSDGIAENIYQNWLYDEITYYNGIPVYDWNSQSELASSTVNGWMASPGHRSNILESSYDKEGIGVAISSDYKVYITQDFW
jgi:uncharacterized protein YkwD